MTGRSGMRANPALTFIAGIACFAAAACGEVHSDAPEAPDARDLVTLTVATIGMGGVTSAPSGIDCGQDCNRDYPQGTTVALTAKAAAGFALSAWGGACAGTDASICTVTLDAAKTATATFAPSFALEVKINGAGAVTSSPPGIDCGLDCAESFAQGTRVTLTPTPSADARFTGWSGLCTGTAPCVVTVAQAQQVTAAFESKVKVSVRVAGGGTVTGPDGFTCSSECDARVFAGTEITLVPVLVGGRGFMGWGLGCTGLGNCKLRVTTDAIVTATFGFKLTVFLDSTCQSTGMNISSNPSGIDCGVGNVCSALFQAGTEVRVDPRGVSACQYDSSDGCTRDDARGCVVLMDRDRQYTARFRPD